MRFKFVPYKEGIKFKAYGNTIEEVFENSAIAMFAAMNDDDKIASTQQLKIKVKGRDMESLLYNFLGELIILSSAKKFFLSKVRDIRLDKKGFKLIAKISGDDLKNYEITQKIKGVIFKEISFKKENKRLMAEVVLSI